MVKKFAVIGRKSRNATAKIVSEIAVGFCILRRLRGQFIDQGIGEGNALSLTLGSTFRYFISCKLERPRPEIPGHLKLITFFPKHETCVLNDFLRFIGIEYERTNVEINVALM